MGLSELVWEQKEDRRLCGFIVVQLRRDLAAAYLGQTAVATTTATTTLTNEDPLEFLSRFAARTERGWEVNNVKKYRIETGRRMFSARVMRILSLLLPFERTKQSRHNKEKRFHRKLFQKCSL